MKLCSVIIGLVVSGGLFFNITGCKTKAAPWPSLGFAGNFSGTETCLLNGASSDTIHIVATSDTAVSITNLYGLSQAIVGIVSHDSCTIQPQINNGYVVQGLLLLSSDTINLSIIATSFGKRDECNAILIKH